MNHSIFHCGTLNPGLQMINSQLHLSLTNIMIKSKLTLVKVFVIALLWQSVNAQANYHNQAGILTEINDLAAVEHNISWAMPRDNVTVIAKVNHHPPLQLDRSWMETLEELPAAEDMTAELQLCPPGYKMAINGVSCMDINECAVNNGGCSLSPRVPCINTKGSFRCGFCPVGWIGDGRSCDLASIGSREAPMIGHPLAKCEYILNALTCICPDGMFGNGFGPDGCHINACGNHKCRKNMGYLLKNAHGDGKYIIKAPRGMSIKLTADFKMLQADSSILIYGNATKWRSYLLKNVTKDAFVEEIYNFDIITIFVFHNAHWATDAHYEFLGSATGCGGNFTGAYGRIASPNWPEPYANNTECIWTISAPLGRQIELMVENFTLEGDSDDGDFLEIRNGMFKDSPLIGHYYTNEIPIRISSFANSLFLRFKTNASREGPGFLITWQQTKIGCGGTLTSYKGSIQSPSFYGSSIIESQGVITCAWQIHVAQGSSISITLNTSNEVWEFCRSNALKIFDDFSNAKSLLPLNCSQAQIDGHFNIFSTSNAVLVVFNPTKDIDFILDYETNCHNVKLNEIHGVIETPKTSHRLNCNWDIRARGTNKVKLAFSHLHLESLDMACPNDMVMVWDMMNAEVLKKYQICGIIPPPIISMGNHLIVRFATESEKLKNSFRAEYSQIGCSEVITNPLGNISSPQYPYSIDIDCVWHFKAPAGKQIILNIKELKIDFSNHDCLTDSLTVKESETSSRFLLKACSSQDTESIITSPANQLYVSFHTGPNRTRKYFKATYTTVEGICGGTLKSSRGAITSPNYPLNSTQGNLCKWKINVPTYAGIILNLTDIQLSQSPDCSEAYLKILKIQDKKEVLLKKFCSTDGDQTVHTNESNLAIEYAIGGVQNWGRFSLEFIRQCGGKISKESGYIKSYAGDNCHWWFEVPDGTVLRLNIVNFECDCTNGMAANGNKCINGLGIKEIPHIGPSSNHTNFYCDEYQSHWTFEGTTLHIYAKGIRFGAEYSTIGNPLGWFVKSAHGLLEWSPIRGVYRPYEYTKWFFDATEGNLLQFQISELNIAKSDYCNEDYLEMLGTSTEIGVYCGQTPPNYTLTSNSCSLRLRSSLVGSTTNSFKLKWSYAHLNEISNETEGVIQSPPITMVRNEDEPFAWRIRANTNFFIALDFEHYLEGLELFDGYDDTSLNVTTSYPSPWQFVSKSNVVYIKTINSKLQYFLIRWRVTIHPKPDKPTCHSELFVKSQQEIVVSSPGYPMGYEPNLHCDWIFKPFEASEHILCELYNVMIEETDQCLADSLTISSDLENSHDNEKICNSSSDMAKPLKIFHGRPNIKIDFVSDYTISGEGFRAVIKTVCGSNLTDPVGIIEGGKLQSNEAECIWRVSTKPTTRILLQLNFAPMNQSYHDSIFQEYFSIYDGGNENAPMLMPEKICNAQNGTEIFLNSNSNILTIKYKLSSTTKEEDGFFNNKGGGWKLKYRAYTPCSSVMYRLTAQAPSVNVTSPNYPDVPLAHTECEWTIEAPVGKTIQVDFIDMFNTKIQDCENEYLEIFDGSTSLARSIGRFCQKPQTLRTTQHVMYIRYVAGDNEPRISFKAHMSLGKCGGSFSEMNGVLISPGYSQPGGYAFLTECDYFINLPADVTVQLIIKDVHLPFDAIRPKSKDYLEVMSKCGEDEQPVYIYGNATEGQTYHFNANKVLVRFHTFFANLEYRGFRIEYHGFEGKCKQIATSDSGYLTMGLVKAGQHDEVVDANCEWKIVVAKGRSVRLKFLNLNDYRGHNQTEYPRISVFTDPECACKIFEFDINTYNANSMIQSSDNIMIVRIYMPQDQHRMKPVKAHYTSDDLSPCPAIIDSTKDSGTIEIRHTSSEFSRPYYCDIPISLSDRETLVFNIVNFRIVYDKLPGNQMPAPLTIWDDKIFEKYHQNQTNVIQMHNRGGGAVRIVQTDTWHIRSLQINYRLHKCGGYFKLSSWETELKQPAVKDISYGPIVCVWTLMQDRSWCASRGHQISGNFTFTDSCDMENITIESGQNRDSIKICRDKHATLKNYDLLSDITQIIYQSRNFNYQSSKLSMAIDPTVVCDKEVEVVRLSNYLEVYQKGYQNNQHCVWTIYTAPGLQLLFEFLGIGFIEESPNCTKDYLEFQRYEAGIWTPDVRFCGRPAQDKFNGTSTRMRVIWKTNEVITGHGFSLYIRSHCSLTLNVTSSLQRIQSPAAVFDKNRTLRCDYTFHTNEAEKMIRVKIKFNGTCAKDHFYVSELDANGVESKVPHCDSEVEFKSRKFMRLDFNVYEMDYYTIEYVLDSCGGNITTSGSLIRPDHNDWNDNGMDCVWYVMAPTDYSIAFRFEHFDTDADQGFVMIYVGSSLDDAKLLKSFSGNLSHNVPVFTVDHNQAIISAVPKSFLASNGFAVKVVFIPKCDEAISLTDATSPFKLARYYRLRAGKEYLCSYSVTAPKGHRIGIEIRQLQINNIPCPVTNETCKINCNALEIYDSLAMKQECMDIFCTSPTAGSFLISSYEDAIVTLSARQPGELKFEIVFTMKENKCGYWKTNEADESEILELTFPPSDAPLYDRNIHCTWRLPLNHWTEIALEYMDLKNDSQATGRCIDYIEITYEKVFAEYYDKAFNFTLNVLKSYGTNNYTDITFHSGASIEGKGFKILILRSTTCNRTYRQFRGVIDFSKRETVCRNTISVPDHLIVNIYVTDMNGLNRWPECSKRHNKIIDKRTKNILFDLCQLSNGTKTIVFKTKTNAVHLDFMDNIRVYYSTSPRDETPVCGNTWTGMRGMFAGVSFENDDNFPECRWDRAVLDFAIDTRTESPVDNVQVIDVKPVDRENLLPKYFVSAANHVTFVSKISSNFNETGWRFNMNCYLWIGMIEIENNRRINY